MVIKAPKLKWVMMINLHKPEKYICDQLARASFSIVLNIAEGSGKSSNNDRKNYFTIARGSVFECVAVLDILSEQEQISIDVYELNLKLADEISRMLFTMIRNLAK